MFCCVVMKNQLTDRCEQHGVDCPDKVVLRSKSVFNDSGIYLRAINAEWVMHYCPWCGSKWSDGVPLRTCNGCNEDSDEHHEWCSRYFEEEEDEQS